MSDECTHADAIRDVTPSALGCEECLKIGSPLVHLAYAEPAAMLAVATTRRTTTLPKHFHNTRHPIIGGRCRPRPWSGNTCRPSGSIRSALVAIVDWAPEGCCRGR